MSINVVTANINYGQSSITLTPTLGVNRAIFIQVYNFVSISSVTCNGVAMSYDAASSVANADVYYITGVSSGTNTIVVTASSYPSDRSISAICVDNVNQSSPFYTSWTSVGGAGNTYSYTYKENFTGVGSNPVRILRMIRSTTASSGQALTFNHSYSSPSLTGGIFLNGTQVIELDNQGSFGDGMSIGIIDEINGNGDFRQGYEITNTTSGSGVPFSPYVNTLHLQAVPPPTPIIPTKVIVKARPKTGIVGSLISSTKAKVFVRPKSAIGNVQLLIATAINFTKARVSINPMSAIGNVHTINLPTITNMSLLKPQLTVQCNTGNTLRIRNDIYYQSKTYTTSDVNIGSVSLPVDNATHFQSTNSNILFGILGQENSEVLRVNSIGNLVIGTTAATKFVHNRGESIQELLYDYVSIESATVQGGTYSILVEKPIDFTSNITSHQDNTSVTTMYYRVRFKNSITGMYTAYSEEATGFIMDETTVGYLISQVRNSVGDTPATDEFLIAALNEARGIVDTDYRFGTINEWRQNFDYGINLVAGQNFVELPSTIDFTETTRSLLNARYTLSPLGSTTPLKYVDKRQWNTNQLISRVAYVNGDQLAGQTELSITNAGDFGRNGGTAYVATDGTGTTIRISYTGVNMVDNKLTGCILPVDINNGRQVWAMPFQTFPLSYTVFHGRIWFEKVIPDSLQGRVLYIDFYEKLTPITSLTDSLPEHFRSLYQHFLRFALKRRLDDNIGQTDSDYVRFDKAIKMVMSNSNNGQEIRIIN